MTSTELLYDFSKTKDYISPIQYNLLKILEAKGPLTRKDLVKHLNTARTTIYDNLIKLQKRKLVKKYPKPNGNRGRPKIWWCLL